MLAARRRRLEGTHGRRSSAVLVALVLALTAVTADQPFPAVAQSSSEELREARAERDRLQRELDQALSGVTEERGFLTDVRARLQVAQGQLRIAEGQLALAEEALATAELRVDVADQELAIATRLLAEAQEDLAREQDDFAEQVVTVYKYGIAVRAELVITMIGSSTDPGDLSRNLYRMGAILDHQDSIIQRVTQLRDEFAEAELEALAAGDAAREIREAAELEIAFVADRRAEAEELKRQVAAEEAAQKRVLDLAAGDANGIATRLAAAEERVRRAEAAQKRADAAARGGVLCPIEPVWFSNDWGYPRSGGRTHKGNDLFADEGTPMVAIADGTIRNLDYTDTYVPGSNRGDLGGISISYWVDSNEYWYWAHMQSLEPGLREGARITAGQVLGYVGKTGNAYNTPPHAHVGRYVNGSAVNPFPTLNPACN